MGAVETFCFSGFTLRPAGERGDFDLASAWTEADPHHRSTVLPEFWLEQCPGRDSYLFLDQEGPLFFFKMILFIWSSRDRAKIEKRCQLHIQFSPRMEEKHERQRVMRGLREGLAWLEAMLKQCQVKELFFDSRSESLVDFTVKRLGFEQVGETLSKRIPG